jgi:hypothetical protein
MCVSVERERGREGGRERESTSSLKIRLSFLSILLNLWFSWSSKYVVAQDISLQRVEKGVSTTGVGVSLHVAASLAIVSEKR